MKKVNTIIYALLATAGVLSLNSCQKDEKIGGTAVQNLSGEYWVKLDNGADPTGTFDDSYYTISIYNTASNRPDSAWIEDDAASGVPFWDIKGKIGTSVTNRTFSGANIVNQEYDSHFTITNGKIIPKAATAPGTKSKTDSITFNIQFDDDPVPGTIHKVTGYARTKFDADDHY